MLDLFSHTHPEGTEDHAHENEPVVVVNKTKEVVVTPEVAEEDSTNAGPVSGGVVAVIFCLGCGFVCLKKQKKKRLTIEVE